MNAFQIALLCLLTFTATIPGASPVHADQAWREYPETLPRFDFSGERLHEHWPALTAGMRGPFPDEEALLEEAERYPELFEHTEALLRKRAEKDPGFAPFAEAPLDERVGLYADKVQQAWRLLFEGDFRAARDLGLSLGPAGYFPGLYAQALYAVHLEPEADRRRELLEEVIANTGELLPHAPDHVFLNFGNAYAKSRIMETQSRTEALRSGYTREVKARLEELLEDDPENSYAASLLAGIHAGIIDKAGSFLARTAFGATASRMEQYFEQAMEQAADFPTVHVEYARARRLVYGENDDSARELLETAADMEPASAEEALLVDKARRLLEE